MIKKTFTGFTWKLAKSNRPTNCPAKFKSLLWINNHLFWTYQCLCCHTYQFEKGKLSQEWGGIYD